MTKILFICSSNRTRSPLAAAWFRHLLDEAGATDIEVDSAGLRTLYHGNIAPEVGEALALVSPGLVPLRVGSQPLQPKLIKSSDLLVCMTDDQLTEIKKNFISASSKTITLMSVLHQDKDIFDPNKQPVQRYVDCLNMMKPALQELADRVADR